jgi:putative SOS response-associated peptidase YedK
MQPLLDGAQGVAPLQHRLGRCQGLLVRRPERHSGLKRAGVPPRDEGRLPTFRDAYARRRCILPIDGFFEWKAIRGVTAKQPFAIAMRDGAPFGVAGIWENWRNPVTTEWLRTFAVITVPANDLVGQIHDRMPAILAPASYDRWLGDEPDPRELMRPFPSELMRMWPISTRVNKTKNDDPSILDEVELLSA